MRLLLKEPVDSLGEPGDEVRVRAGFARNYLLPRRLALPVSEENRRAVAEAREVWAVQRVEELRAAKALAESLDNRWLRFERRVKTGSDELYGSVSALDLSRELGKAGFDIPRHRILLGQPIKVVGESSVTVRLHPEVSVELRVEVAPSAAASLGAHPAAPLARAAETGPEGSGDETGPDGTGDHRAVSEDEPPESGAEPGEAPLEGDGEDG